MVGEVIDKRYRLLRLLGEGGMGSVYEAAPVVVAPEMATVAGGQGGRVAIKLIHVELLGRRHKTSLPRFHREARAASAIDTDHIAQVLEFGTDPISGAPYMVMELLSGETLEELLDRVELLKPTAALKIAAQVCIALEKAHAARVIHRDIKPANLFLARSGAGNVVVKMLDFGLAKIKPPPGEETSGLSRSGSMMGSPRYMSPEQAKGSRGIDFRTDIWSLGMVLLHALSGNPPHHTCRSLGDLILTLCTSPPRLSAESVPWVAPEVLSLLHRTLMLDPEERFESATELLTAIKPLLAEGWELHEADLAPPPGRAHAQAKEPSRERILTTEADLLTTTAFTRLTKGSG